MTTFVDSAIIRHYIANMLKDAVDVGGRVFMNRPSAVNTEELPLVIVMMDEGEDEVWAGTNECVQEYKVNQRCAITIVVDQRSDGGDDPDQNEQGADYLDWLSYQVKWAFKKDYSLAQRLDGYDPNTNYKGLVYGHRFTGHSTYEATVENERKILARQIRLELPYSESGIVDTVLNSFEQYHATIGNIELGGNVIPVTAGNSIARDISYSDFAGADVAIGVVPSRKTVAFVVVTVIDVFDDTPIMTVGDDLNNDRFLQQNDANLLYEFSYMTMPTYQYLNATEVKAYLSGSPTQGKARVTIYYY